MLLTKRLLKNRVAENVKDLLGKTGKDCTVNPPFYCDYGSHIEVGENFFANYNCLTKTSHTDMVWEVLVR